MLDCIQVIKYQYVKCLVCLLLSIYSQTNYQFCQLVNKSCQKTTTLTRRQPSIKAVKVKAFKVGQCERSCHKEYTYAISIASGLKVMAKVKNF